MQLTAVLLPFIAGLAAAAPILEARANPWVVQAFTRYCNAAPATSCHYSYGINRNDGSAVTACAYDVANSGSTPANRASYAVGCGSYAISSGWSGQFGEGNGFQTLAIKYNGQIIYAAYSDAELVNNTAVQPDKSYSPQAIQQAALAA